MLNQLYSSPLYLAVTKGMEASSLRQRTYANNIANVDTPHFKRAEVNFEDAFKLAMEKSPHRLVGFKTDFQHFPINPPTSLDSVRPTIWRENDTFTRADDNNVDMDVENAEIAKNELVFNALTDVLSRKFAGLRNVMKK